MWAKASECNGSSDSYITAGNDRSLAVDGSGNVHLVGRFKQRHYNDSEDCDFDPGPGEAFALVGQIHSLSGFVWKLDSAGNYQWVKAFLKAEGQGTNNIFLCIRWPWMGRATCTAQDNSKAWSTSTPVKVPPLCPEDNMQVKIQCFFRSWIHRVTTFGLNSLGLLPPKRMVGRWLWMGQATCTYPVTSGETQKSIMTRGTESST